MSMNKDQEVISIDENMPEDQIITGYKTNCTNAETGNNLKYQGITDSRREHIKELFANLQAEVYSRLIPLERQYLMKSKSYISIALDSCYTF